MAVIRCLSIHVKSFPELSRAFDESPELQSLKLIGYRRQPEGAR